MFIPANDVVPPIEMGWENDCWERRRQPNYCAL